MSQDKTTELRYPTTVDDSGDTLVLQVCKSGAGYYLGYLCKDGCPWDRTSGYFAEEYEATTELLDIALELGRIHAKF
jgi:hypothetical protein